MERLLARSRGRPPSRSGASPRRSARSPRPGGAGSAVPGELSLVGFHDAPIAALPRPAAHDGAHAAAARWPSEASTVCCGWWTGSDATDVVVRTPPVLVERGSTARSRRDDGASARDRRLGRDRRSRRAIDSPGDGRDVALYAHRESRRPRSDWPPSFAERGVRAEVLVADLMDRRQAEALVGRALERLGDLEVHRRQRRHRRAAAHLTSLTPDDDLWDRMLAIHLTAPFVTARAAIPHLPRPGWRRDRQHLLDRRRRRLARKLRLQRCQSRTDQPHADDRHRVRGARNSCKLRLPGDHRHADEP